MSIHAISWVLKHSESRLGARLVLIVIADHAKEDGTGSWPSVATIARESRLTPREVQYGLRELENIGELGTEISAGPSGTNLYKLLKMSWGEKFSGALESAGGGARLRRGALESAQTVLEPSLEPSKRILSLPILGQEQDPKILREKVEQQNAAKEERKLRKQQRASGQRPTPARASAPAKIETKKQPEEWVWFAAAFRRMTGVNAFSRDSLWPLLEEMISEIGREEAEERLSAFVDGSGYVSGFLAKDFLEGSWRTVEANDGSVARIVNEEED